MNANQLADELQKMFVGEEYDRLVHEIPDLLRQQQAEIEALKKEKWLTEIEIEQRTLKKIIDILVLHHDTLACTSYPMSKENRK